MSKKLMFECCPSTGLYTIVTDLDSKVPIEQIRSGYENVGSVLRAKMYLTARFGRIAILEVGDYETLLRASCRRVQTGDYLKQSIYTFKHAKPQIQSLIQKKTKVKLSYELPANKDPTEFKESLLQLLSKAGGPYFIKKIKCLGVRNEFLIAVEASFSLSKLSSDSQFIFKQVQISFTYVEDFLEDACLDEILVPEYVSMSPNLSTKGANMNFVIRTFCERLFFKYKEEEEEKIRQTTQQDFRFWVPVCPEDDELEDVFPEEETPQTDSGLTGSVFEARSPDTHFNPESNLEFLSKYDFGFSDEGSAIRTHVVKKKEPAVDCLNKVPLSAGTLKQQLKAHEKDQAESDLADTSLIPVEIRLVEVLHKLVQFSSVNLGISASQVSQEVLESIAGKIDPDTPAHQMLRVTLKILKTKYRKVKRRERKRVSRDCDAQDESVDDEPLGGGAKADGHPLVCEVVSRLNGSGETGYTFGSEELWRVLQSCDPDWRDFIWKYRTVQDFLEFVPEFGSVETTLKMKVSPQSSQLHNLQSSSPTPAKIPQNSKLVSEQSEIYETQFYGTGFEAFGTHNHNNARIEGTTSVQFVNPHAPKQPTPHRHASVYSPFCDRFRVATKINLPISLRNKVCSIEGKTTPSSPSQEASRSTCKPHAQAELPTATASGEDRWTVHHIESNLRFNRMVTPMLWR